MKNFKVYIATVALAFSFFPVSLKADTGNNVKTTEPTKNTQIRAELLINRLEEIKDIDKSDMNSSEKKEIRKEVRAAHKELKESSGGVYLSVGAILLIALLLILFL
ncbi:hypothetical protein QYS49_23025 [Marivirga salinae]|uniref:Seryl-tRNA synthetase n=1 Tax=Marivirga salinarum TaxID=3059078 RepID=A0AA49GAH3_9BACT|nr:hypothetical protein [Marivirga sp. BDSF4-3]WKK74571.1 hypothetical protein QYS49_23025 [Marivirga sp. BDSF4-3]